MATNFDLGHDLDLEPDVADNCRGHVSVISTHVAKFESMEFGMEVFLGRFFDISSIFIEI